MDNNMKFSLAIDILNQKIAKVTIKLSKDLTVIFSPLNRIIQ